VTKREFGRANQLVPVSFAISSGWGFFQLFPSSASNQVLDGHTFTRVILLFYIRWKSIPAIHSSAYFFLYKKKEKT
jgi:hypothetical protein